MRYDSIIVGTGPAGLEAALNLKIRRKSFLLVGSKNLSSKVNKAPKIHNYLGIPQTTGAELKAAFLNHLKDQEIEIHQERITTVYPMGKYFSVATAENVYEATTIILSPGVYAASPFIGEEKFLGRGVGYCATCDAPLYKGKVVAIVGTSLEAESEANYVSELASQVIYIPIRQNPTLLNDSIKVVQGQVKEIVGDKKAEQLVLSTGVVEADGIFILRESLSPSSLVPGIETEGAHIKVNEHMETNIPGCFAAGDATGKPYQYIRAAGQGLIAAHSAVAYLGALTEKEKIGKVE